ncbi:MAG: ABC transporter permease [Tenericutes bacterium]|jgi:cell division transport system permease protein|nr:permease-like cell division protein FtsX [Bacilli bacterium]MDD3995854.1 permease-like cell division protein FtsX [Bacilli bacterium]MDD4832027.1 permease-like cell division protein FtsX [Bacilli bacterium]NLV90604.1 ABC transporter permease [Mycoplasmatota bacterium]
MEKLLKITRKELINMKWIRILGRSIKDASNSVFRNMSLSVASISCIAITLIVVSLAMLLSYNVDNATKLIEKDFTIVSFVENKATDKQIKEIEKLIAEMDNVESYKYKSKEEVLEEAKASDDVFKTIIEGWDEDENPLQAAFLIKAKDIDEIEKTSNEIKKIEGISLVRYGENVIKNMLSTFDAVEKVLIIIVVSLVVVTAFLISNTIKLTIFSRKREIEIMRVVGASNTNIKTPFIVEGIFLSVLGSILPIIFTIYGYNYLYSNSSGSMFSSYLKFLKLVEPTPFVYIVSLMLITIGIIVGTLGSSRAVRKYLKI